MNTQKPLLGLCPIGKFVFSNEDAIRQKELIKQKLVEWEVPFVDLEGILEDGLVKDQKHVAPVVEHFRAERVQCLFLPHCNFGTEGAAGMIAHQLGLPTLLVLSVATSIDALAVGFSLALLHHDVVAPILVIGGVTFVVSLAGVLIGDRFGHLFESKVEIAGGLVLIGIGVKILIEHG